MNETHNAYDRTDAHGRYVGIQFDIEYAERYLREDVSERFYNKEQAYGVISSVSKTGMSTEELENMLWPGPR